MHSYDLFHQFLPLIIAMGGFYDSSPRLPLFFFAYVQVYVVGRRRCAFLLNSVRGWKEKQRWAGTIYHAVPASIT